MRRDVVLVLAAAMVLVALAVPTFSVEARNGDGVEPDEPVEPVPEPTEYTVYGYVSNISDQEMNVPLSGVTVSLLDADGRVIGTDTTGSDGMFEFTYDADSGASMLRFDITGYMVRTLPGTMDQDDDQPDKSLVSFSIDGITPDEDGRYCLSGNGSSANAVGMALTNGTIFGRIVSSDTGEGLEGATVVAMNSAGRQYSAVTDDEGYFEMTIPYGSYSLQASCSGFATSSPMAASTSAGTGVTVQLAPNEFGIDALGGMDTPHAMLVIGLVLIGLIMLSVLLLIRKSREPESGVVIVNDLSQYEESEDDGLERP